jgi:hypothetical protein
MERPNLIIMGTEEEKVAIKWICYILKKIITEDFPNLEKVFPIQLPEHQIDLPKTDPLHSILSLKQQAQRRDKKY